MSYQIRPGDTLSGIASRHHTTVAALLKANPQIHNPNLIYAGARLSIPGASDSFQPAAPSGGARYTVRPATRCQPSARASASATRPSPGPTALATPTSSTWGSAW